MRSSERSMMCLLSARYRFAGRLVFVVAAMAVRTLPSLADTQAFNTPRLFAGTNGTCYATSEPKHSYGDAGRTEVYSVRSDGDQLLVSFDWYSVQLYLKCVTRIPEGGSAISVVRRGRWPGGKKASHGNLGLAFYLNDRELASYSTLDLAGSPGNVRSSTAHHQVIAEILGYRWVAGQTYVFEVCTIDGSLIAFSPHTGERESSTDRDDARCKRWRHAN